MKVDLQDTCKRLFEKIHKDIVIDENGQIVSYTEACSWPREQLSDSISLVMGYSVNDCRELFGEVYLIFEYQDGETVCAPDVTFTAFDFGSAYEAARLVLKCFAEVISEELCLLQANILLDETKPKPKYGEFEISTCDVLNPFTVNLIQGYANGNFTWWESDERPGVIEDDE